MLMSLRSDIKAARDALDKLNTYSDGVKAARGTDATKKYKELNSIADRAIRKLPVEYRTRFAMDLSRIVLK
jgi:hypothetical protein